MKIIAYESADAPAHLRWNARHLDGQQLLPVGFVGPTEAGVRAAAQKFWDEEQAKIIAKGVKRQKRTKAPEPSIEDVDVV